MDIIVNAPNPPGSGKPAPACVNMVYCFRFFDAPPLELDDRVYVAWDGKVRGFAEVWEVMHYRPRSIGAKRFALAGPGYYVIAPIETWKWIRPLSYNPTVAWGNGDYELWTDLFGDPARARVVRKQKPAPVWGITEKAESSQ